MYSETRLVHTLKGKWKKVRTATEDASPFWVPFITHFSRDEIAFQGIMNLKTCREIEIETERLGNMLVIRKTENQRKRKKVILEGNWYVIFDFVPHSVRLIRKNVHVFRLAMSVIKRRER